MASPTSAMVPNDNTTSETDRFAHIPTHRYIKFFPDRNKLTVTLNFMSHGPHPSEETLDHLLEMINILPLYARETNILYLSIFFRPRDKDDLRLTPARHLVIGRVVEEINEFPYLTKFRVCLRVDRFHWDQVADLASALYGIRTLPSRRAFNVGQSELAFLENGCRGRYILPGSSLDRDLRSRFRH
ncbi:dab76abb-4b9d-409d-9856-d6222893f30a [Sclerotinia trifoliorum]|uniref:Dab76abb-4b9d-409d-9856-d6222893f30a n=1 Tax=Sclerotinia trifoliorum TaxID=28548 RepID=A0A8H2VM42_9HELO|nr:dab76abb-4b9d-409d-9856-d6222893f30a [Sclerotinia trifoliorum]